MGDLDLAIATTATGINLPATGQEGYAVKVADALSAGVLFQYVPPTAHSVTFATHTARVADAATRTLGEVARVTSDGTLWQLTDTGPTWELMAPLVAAKTLGSITDSGGTQVTDLALEDGFVYHLAVSVRTDDGSSGIEFLDSYEVYARAASSTASIDVQGQGLTNSAASWATVVSATGAVVRTTVTNSTGSARDGLTVVSITGVQATP